jgi:hypothetical protein
LMRSRSHPSRDEVRADASAAWRNRTATVRTDDPGTTIFLSDALTSGPTATVLDALQAGIAANFIRLPRVGSVGPWMTADLAQGSGDIRTAAAPTRRTRSATDGGNGVPRMAETDVEVEERIAETAPRVTKDYARLWRAYLDVADAAQGRNARQHITRVATGPQMRIVAKWEGVVHKVLDDSFVARLTDEYGHRSEVEAEIYVSEVAPADIDLLRPRAVFYWVMGYRDTQYGDRIRESRLRFRRLPGWRPQDVEDAQRWAERARAELGWG